MSAKDDDGSRLVREPKVEARNEEVALPERTENYQNYPGTNGICGVGVKLSLSVPHYGLTFKEEWVH
jgi:hypothetical protein